MQYSETANLSEYYFRGIIPGWAQFYSERTLKGSLFLGGFILSGSLAIWAYFNYSAKKEEYRDAPLGTSREDFDKKFDDYKRATNTGKLSLGLLALIYAGHWADVLFFSRPSNDDSMGYINYGNTFFSFNINNGPFSINETRAGLSSGIKF